MMISDKQKSDLADALKRTYFRNHPLQHFETPEGEVALRDHVDGRYSILANTIMPWLSKHTELDGASVVEIGCGTGSSTAAISPYVDRIIAFEIQGVSIEAAKERAAILGYDNVEYVEAHFDDAQADRLAPIDGVFLSAVLEHCTFDECISLLKASWKALRPGGWLCVVDTPNRLSPFDHHTAFLPFYSVLPMEVRRAYIERSPRKEFVEQIQSSPPADADLLMTRWGNGISYHEFELALGENIHHWIVADGWEREINALLGVLPEDLFTELTLKTFAPTLNRAFARRAFHFIAKKPAH